MMTGMLSILWTLQKGLAKGAGSVIAEGTPDLPLIAADLHSSATAHASVNA